MSLEEIREICLLLPFATAGILYETDLCYSVGNKIFPGTRITGSFRTGIKCGEFDFGELIERDGIVAMPRLSTTFWIRIEKNTALSKAEWQHFIRKSYALLLAELPKKYC
jgi:predicted DNA-binding protein (MmcQ/YjbR family)